MHHLAWYLSLLPSYLELVTLSLGFIFLFSLPAISLFDYLGNEYKKLYFTAPYISILLFILSTHLVWSLTPLRKKFLYILAFLILVCSCKVIFRKRGAYKYIKPFIRKNLRNFVVLFPLTFLLSLWLFNLTWQNGLHDESFHHAVIAIFEQNEAYPFDDPLYIGRNLSYYHGGLYLIVILIRNLTNLTIERSFDLAKFILFLPGIPVLSLFITSLFPWLSKPKALIACGFGLISGPILFFFDTLSNNVLGKPALPQIYTPVLFELAGLTWYGFFFSIVVLVITQYLASLPQKKKTIALACVFLLLAPIGLQLINQAFVVIIVATVPIYIFHSTWKNATKIIVGFSFLIGILVAFLTTGYIINSQASSSGLENQFGYEKNEGLQFIRNKETQGFAYFDDLKVKDRNMPYSYSNVSQPLFLKLIGISIPLSIGLFVFAYQKKLIAKRDFLISIIILIGLPLSVYYLKIPISDLAMTKLLRPAFFLAPASLIAFYYLVRNKIMKSFLLFCIMCSVIPALTAFTSFRLVNAQRDWIITDEDLIALISYIKQQNIYLSSIVTNSVELAYVLSNNLAVQVQPCYEECKLRVFPTYYIRNTQLPHLDNTTKSVNFGKYSISTYANYQSSPR